MKKIYIKPYLKYETFIANESISACWNIKCNVPNGVGYYETNGKDGFQVGEDTYIAAGSGCGTSHEASGIDAAGPSGNAMWQPGEYFSGGGGPWGGPQEPTFVSSGNAYEVFYFQARGNYGTSNHHFCTLDSVNWNKNPNASN